MTPISAVRLFHPLVFVSLFLSCAAFAQEADVLPPDAPAQDAPNAVTQEVTATPDPPSTMALEVQSISPPPANQIPDIDPIALYGGDMQFDVFRKNTKIGEHTVNFTRTGDDLTVTSRMNLAVDVLFITAYKFSYESTEIWRKGELVAVVSNVADNGKVAKTNARVEDGLFKIDGPRGSTIGSSWVFPTSHWHRGQANDGTILNTLTGRLSKVEIVRRGIDRVATAQGSVDADHLEYTGQLRDTEVWYDANNRWVKMRFKARDGSAIEYRCRQCGLAAGAGLAIADDALPAPQSIPDESPEAEPAQDSPAQNGPAQNGTGPSQ